MVQWYNISWFHNKVRGFHSLIASNLYKRNIDASSYSCLTEWGPTIHIHSQNLDKKRPSWLSTLTQFSSPQHGCPTLGYSLYHPLISALIFVVHFLKKLFHQNSLTVKSNVAPKNNDLTNHFRKIKFHSQIILHLAMVVAKNGHACRRSVPLVISNLWKPATRMVLCPATFPRSHSTQHL